MNFISRESQLSWNFVGHMFEAETLENCETPFNLGTEKNRSELWQEILPCSRFIRHIHRIPARKYWRLNLSRSTASWIELPVPLSTDLSKGDWKKMNSSVRTNDVRSSIVAPLLFLQASTSGNNWNCKLSVLPIRHIWAVWLITY